MRRSVLVRRESTGKTPCPPPAYSSEWEYGTGGGRNVDVDMPEPGQSERVARPLDAAREPGDQPYCGRCPAMDRGSPIAGRRRVGPGRAEDEIEDARESIPLRRRGPCGAAPSGWRLCIHRCGCDRPGGLRPPRRRHRGAAPRQSAARPGPRNETPLRCASRKRSTSSVRPRTSSRDGYSKHRRARRCHPTSWPALS